MINKIRRFFDDNNIKYNDYSEDEIFINLNEIEEIHILENFESNEIIIYKYYNDKRISDDIKEEELFRFKFWGHEILTSFFLSS